MWQIVKRKDWKNGYITLERELITDIIFYWMFCVYNKNGDILYTLSVSKFEGEQIFNKLSGGNLL